MLILGELHLIGRVVLRGRACGHDDACIGSRLEEVDAGRIVRDFNLLNELVRLNANISAAPILANQLQVHLSKSIILHKALDPVELRTCATESKFMEAHPVIVAVFKLPEVTDESRSGISAPLDLANLEAVIFLLRYRHVHLKTRHL